MVLLLCQFHEQQAHWAWLWSGAHGVVKGDRQILFHLFRRLVYAESEEEFLNNENDMKSHKCYLKYSKYQKYLEKYWLEGTNGVWSSG